MSPFSIKFQANWRKLKIRPFFSDVRNFAHTQILLSPSCSGYPIYPKYKFSSQSEKVENSAVFSDGRNFAHTQILLSPSFSGYPIYPKYKISSQSDKVEISRIQWISCENEKSQNFFISAIVLRIPDIPYIPNFKRIGQSWKFGRFFGRSKFRSHKNFIITIIFRIPDIPKVPNFKPIGQGWNFANSVRISCENEKWQNFFICAIVLRISHSPYIPNFERIGQSWKFDPFFGRPKFREFCYFEKISLHCPVSKRLLSIIMQSFIQLSLVVFKMLSWTKKRKNKKNN